MKFMYCPECHDVVQMRPTTRACLCGKARGRYLDDLRTVEQTVGSLSLALHNHDLATAKRVFAERPDAWSPFFVMRAYLNPTSEQDVRWVEEVSSEPEEPPTPPSAPGA